MIESSLLRWILSALFFATTLWCARVLVLPSVRLTFRVDAMWHALMGAAMVAMIWPWGMTLPTTPQVVVFVAACGWFFARTVFRPGDHSMPRLAEAHHATMMAGMAWMVATMPSLMDSPAPGPGGGHHHALASGTSTTALTDELAAPVALTAGHLALGLVFVILSLPWLARALDLGRGSPGLRPAAVDHASHAAMSFGMGVMFLATG
ncbi:DUF5134 domain-containing protein [Saccharomonospora sp. NPDC046836]|uniref:DUF5134 domain-containing protein n=1 Tax=Saccharomonospora sp. NPDC046836 TaxID=3156921 RepID=UPI0033E3EC99